MVQDINDGSSPPVDSIETQQEGREESLNDWLITKISRVSQEQSTRTNGTIQSNERDKSIITSDTGSTAVINGSDEDDELIEAEHMRKEVDNGLQVRKIEMFDAIDPLKESESSFDSLDVGSAIPLERRVPSSCSNKSTYTAYTGTTVGADNTTKETYVVESSIMSGETEESQKGTTLPKSHNAIYCLILLALVFGAAAVILFGTWLASTLRENDSLRGAQVAETPTTTFNTSFPSMAPINVPSSAPTVDTLLEIISPFSGKFLDDLNSPQYKVFQWMKNEDAIANDPDTHPERILQRYALINIYAALSRKIPSFASTNECEWPSVICSADPANNDRTWQVTEIRMARMYLNGSIPSEIKLLSSLVFLDLAENFYLYGSIPNELYELENLKYLYLNDCSMTGTLSNDGIANLQLLEDVYLGNNRFSGTVPRNLGSTQGIRPLRKLILHKNQFEGTIPVNMTLSNAIYIDLSFNNLNGSLPFDIGDFYSLKQLYLDHNQFTGTIPGSFGMAGNGSLVTLDLSNNMLTGGLPTTWVDKDDRDATSSIDTINVHNNNLTGVIDNNICKLGVSNKGSLVELEADCDICRCNEFCGDCR